jgi:hypothetical protein
MKKTLYFLPVFFVMLFVSCGPSQKVTSSWKNPQVTTTPSYKKVFITALVSNPNYRSVIERDLAAAAQSRGLQTVSGMDIFPATFTSNNQVSKEEILQKVKAAGADAILTVALVDKQSDTRYVPGTTTYMPHMGYAGFGGYYGYAYGAYYSSPGYYTEDKTYFMEARLFDVATENMIWSAQSEAYNPSKIDKFSRDYTAMLVDRMQQDFGKKK